MQGECSKAIWKGLALLLLERGEGCSKVSSGICTFELHLNARLIVLKSRVAFIQLLKVPRVQICLILDIDEL